MCNIVKYGRTPHGVRGLKYIEKYDGVILSESHPAWGAWIEMVFKLFGRTALAVAPRMGCVD